MKYSAFIPVFYLDNNENTLYNNKVKLYLIKRGGGIGPMKPGNLQYARC